MKDKRRFFTKPDVDLLVERQELKKRIKALDGKLSPLIKAVCDDLGDGAEIRVAGRVVVLSRTEANITEWRTLAHAVASEDEIVEIKSLYSKERVTHKAKVVK